MAESSFIIDPGGLGGSVPEVYSIPSATVPSGHRRFFYRQELHSSMPHSNDGDVASEDSAKPGKRVIIAANYLPYALHAASVEPNHCIPFEDTSGEYLKDKANTRALTLGESSFADFGLTYGNPEAGFGGRADQDAGSAGHRRGFSLDCLRAVYEESTSPSPSEICLWNAFSSSSSSDDNDTSPGLYDLQGYGPLDPPKAPPTLPPNLTVRSFFGGNWGLYTALRSLGNQIGSKVWVGSFSSKLSGLEEDEKGSTKHFMRSEYDCSVVEPESTQVQEGFFRFCKSVMWPIFHSMLLQDHLSCQAQDDWDSYVKTNEAFAETILKEYKDGDVIWVNDYHLMLVPEMLRQQLPDATIGFFLHVPFPTSEIFRCLPVKQQILQGILSSNLIGFQTYEYARHFIMSCTRILGLPCTPRGVFTDTREVAFGTFPIGIDSKRIEKRLARPSIVQLQQQFRARYPGKKIIFSRDKMDPVKGIRQKLQGFSQFLEDCPEWRGKVVLVQISLAGNANYSIEMNELIARINAKFGSLDYSPVVLINQDVTFEHYLALASISDACLITSLRDGMNLTSHEYILCQRDNHGIVILSEFAGTSVTFGSAMRINPWDPIDIADVLQKVLSMDAQERKTRADVVYEQIKRNSGATWARSFLEALQAAAQREKEKASLAAPFLDEKPFLRDYSIQLKPGQKRLLILDYDALIPSFKNILHSLERVKLFKTHLANLSANPDNIIALISERSPEQMEHTIEGLSGLILSADDGLNVLFPTEGRWRSTMAPPDPSWWSRIQDVLEYYAERTPGSWIEVKSAAYVWHFEQADPLFSQRQVKECQTHIQDSIGTNYPIQAVLLGRDRLQVRLRSVGKRQALGHILTHILAQNDVGFAGIFLKATKDDDNIFPFCRSFFSTTLEFDHRPGQLSAVNVGADSKSSLEENLATVFYPDTVAPAVAPKSDIPLYLCAIGSQIPSSAEHCLSDVERLVRLLI